MIVKDYINKTKGMLPWSPISNWSPYLASTNFVSKYCFDDYFKDRTANPAIVIARGKQSFLCYTEDKMRRLHTEAFREYFLKPRKFSARLKKYNQFADKIEKIYDFYTYDRLDKTKWSELVKLLDEIIDLIWRLNAAVWFTATPLDKQLCLEEIYNLKLDINEKELNQIWTRATQPLFNSFDKSQEIDLLSCLSASLSWPQIAEHCQYFFTNYYFNTPSISTCLIRLKHETKNFTDLASARLRLSNLNKQSATRILKYQAWLSRLPSRQKELVEYLQLMMKVRDARKNFFNKGLTIHHRIAERVFKQAGAPFSLIPFYTLAELKKGPAYLRNHLDILEKRRQGFAVYFDYSGKVILETINFPESLKLLRHNYLNNSQGKNIVGNTVLKGQSGSSGRVRGVARIILDAKKDKLKFKKGEILVTGMTRPEFIGLMRLATAVVTNEGGITCHAAIVSRELKIPCVIGTKIATHFLKNGDLVEVDANKGIVKILKR